MLMAAHFTAAVRPGAATVAAGGCFSIPLAFLSHTSVYNVLHLPLSPINL
jgi:hypothetical protein